jgi:hypothetical protein
MCGPVPSFAAHAAAQERAVLGACQPSQQERGLRGAERECPQLLKHAGVRGDIRLAFQADPSACTAQVHESQLGCLGELQDG